MEEEWLGKAVSIHCDEKLGIFQGIIKEISAAQITIVRAFRNGVPLRKQDAEVTLRSTDILKISLIPSYNGQNTVTPTVINKPTPVKQPNFANAGNGLAITASNVQFAKQQQNDSPYGIATSTLTSQISNINISPNGRRRSPPTEKYPHAPSAPQTQQFLNNGYATRSPIVTSKSVAQFFGNLIPPKVEVRLGAAITSCSSSTVSTGASSIADSFGSKTSKPIDIVRAHNNNFDNPVTSYSNGNGNCNSNGNGKARNGYDNGNDSSSNGNGNGNGNKKQRKLLRHEGSSRQNQTFGTSVDDPILHEDFDFEGNLALFDKQALWNVIEAEQKPDLVRQAVSLHQEKYRHDENILVSEPPQLRQIEHYVHEIEPPTDFVTDEGLIIPTIPHCDRVALEFFAKKAGLYTERQIDMLARGATDLAILLLGGARRLTPNNSHQWPKIVVICKKEDDMKTIAIAASTGRVLASHGLKVFLYIMTDADSKKENRKEVRTELMLFKATNNPIVFNLDDIPTPDLVILSTESNEMSDSVKKWLSENRASVLAIDPPASGINGVSIKYSILPILPVNGISSNNCGKLFLCNIGIPHKIFMDHGFTKYKSPFGHKFVIPIHSKD